MPERRLDYMDGKLLPCTFCGGEAEFGNNGFVLCKTTHVVECGCCGAQANGYEVSEDYCAKDKAAEAWNCRTAEPEAMALTHANIQTMVDKRMEGEIRLYCKPDDTRPIEQRICGVIVNILDGADSEVVDAAFKPTYEELLSWFDNWQKENEAT